MQTVDEFLSDKSSPALQTVDEFLGESKKQKSVDEFLGKRKEADDPWSSFVQVAGSIADEVGFPKAVLLGQAQLESGSGKHAPGNNYFGIKGSGTAGSNTLATKEFGAGGYYGQNSAFRAYNSPEESVKDYIRLVQTYPGVKEAIATGDPAKVITAIRVAGYATSPTYIQSVMNTEAYKENQ